MMGWCRRWMRVVVKNRCVSVLVLFVGVYVFFGMELQPHLFEYSTFHKPNFSNIELTNWPFSGNSIFMETSSDNHVFDEQVTSLAPSVFSTAPAKKDEMTILLYTKYYSVKWKTSVQVVTPQMCNHLKTSLSTYKTFKSNMFSTPCRITSDHKYFNESDALIFYSRNLLTTKFPKGYRNERQLWIYMQQESEIRTFPDLNNYSNVFNWTMTHRRDSDVYLPYGYVVPLSVDGNSTASDFIPSKVTNKTGLVAWVASQCKRPSKREVLVRELQKYIKVDVFGKCGKKCPSKDDCFGYVASKYKMYLAFENSLCTDYITEKFYRALKQDVVPIVYGGGESETGQDYLDIAPAGSYINARSFNDPKDLANYLLYLDKNDSAFLKYFEWKKKYEIVPAFIQNASFDRNRWCSLCQRLYEHANEVPAKVKWYEDLWGWWNHGVEQRSKLKVGGNPATSSILWRRFKNHSCVSPPDKLIGTRGR